MSKYHKKFGSFLVILFAMLLLAACGDTATPVPAATTAAAATTTVAAMTTTVAAMTTTSAAAAPDSSGLPKLAKKVTYTVGFAQSESNNPWRLAETQSMQDEAAKLGYKLIVTDAASSTAKQAADVESMIAQKVDVIFVTPREEKPLVPAILKAKAAGIPVFLLDRNVDQGLAVGGKDYVTFIGSDFIQEGQRAADWLTKQTGGKANIIELQGTTGASAATDRQKGFDDAIKASAGMKIVASQDGDFTRDTGRKVMETLLQAHPEVTAVYAHNDEMALGAIAALQAAGKQPGKDVLVVSIDGEKDGIQAVIDGKLGATVECNPRFGPVAFQTMQNYAAGQTIPAKIINQDKFYDSTNAKDSIAASY
jgi:ribose transport system substrate-binding protein